MQPPVGCFATQVGMGEIMVNPVLQHLAYEAPEPLLCWKDLHAGVYNMWS